MKVFIFSFGEVPMRYRKHKGKKINFSGVFEMTEEKKECVLQECWSLAEESKQEGIFLKYPL